MNNSNELSVGWRIGALSILIIELIVLLLITNSTYTRRVGPPVPEKVTDQSGKLIFDHNNIIGGQQIFLKRGLMDNGTVWGHGGYLGPDFSAQYLHNLALEIYNYLAIQKFGTTYTQLDQGQKKYLSGYVHDFISENRYDPKTENLIYTPPEVISFNNQQKYWKDYFSGSVANRGLSDNLIKDEEELKKLTSFFSWAAWASAANVSNKNFSYTNNFPYEPLIGNGPSSAAVLWSALSLIALLAGTAVVLLAFGRFHYLGWKAGQTIYPPQLIPGNPTAGQKTSLKFFMVVIILLLFQTLCGGVMAHFFAEPSNFFGIKIQNVFPTNLLRTWHLQTALLWIATAYVGGGIYVSSLLSVKDPPKHVALINFLFYALVFLVVGSLLGEFLGLSRVWEKVSFWFGSQGWEYLEIGRAWQILLAVGLIIWSFILFRAVRLERIRKEDRELAIIFLLVAFSIPVFYLPAFFFTDASYLTAVETWRFWIIHLWVEGFFELFATVMVAILFYKLGLVARQTATRVIYLDAILFLGAGTLGTGHHWYWTGQSAASMAISATFSAMEVVPLILLTLEASDFIRLMRPKPDDKGKIIPFPHKWAFYFLISVGVWNFIGAGIFGFLINLPVVSYFEAGTNLTPNHGHGALMGVFGMLGIAFMVFAIRQVSTEENWRKVEPFIKLSFWGLNIGLAGMLALQLFPGGVAQFLDVIKNGYWHARSTEFLGQESTVILAWLRLPADTIFIVFGVLPLMYAGFRTFFATRKQRTLTQQ